MTSAADVVFTFSGESFDDATTRQFCRPPDQTLLALAGDPRVGYLLVADPWRSYPVSLARRRPLSLSTPIEVGTRTAVRVRPHRLRRHDSTSIAPIERAYRAYSRRLGQALADTRGERRVRPASAALVTYNPWVAAFADAPWIDRIIFFCQDDWATGEGVRKWWPSYRESYRRMIAQGVSIFAVSEELAERISPDVVVVPNGVIADVWRPRYPVPDRIARLPGPRAIYTGTIDDRLEVGLVEATARQVGSLIFIGHIGNMDTIGWLRSLPNVHVFGTVGQEELAATTQACDVGLIPHRDQEGIRAMSPLKLYEYLSAGLPVLSVDLPPIHGVDDSRVRLSDRADWPGDLTRTIALGPAAEEHRLRFIDEVSWQRRMRPVVDAAVS